MSLVSRFTFLASATDPTVSTPNMKRKMHQPAPLALNQQWHDWDASSLGRHCLSSSSRAYLHLSLGAVLGHHGFSCCSDCGSGIVHTGRLDELAALCACSSLGSCATTGSPYTTSDDSPFQPIRSLSSMQRDCLTTGCDDVAPTSLGDQGCAPSLEETFSRHDWFGDSGNFEPKTEVRIRDFLRHVPESRRSLSQPYNCAKFLLTSAVMHTPTSQSASGCVSCNKSSPSRAVAATCLAMCVHVMTIRNTQTSIFKRTPPSERN